jgi:LPS sulfotransferase NodH
MQTMRAPVRGCKLMLDHLTVHQLTVDDLRDEFPDSRFLIIYRRSLAEQFVSREMAIATNQWYLWAGQERKQAQVFVDSDALRKYCAATRQAYADLMTRRWLPERSELISYEELATDPTNCLKGRICPLLGLPACEPRTILCKQGTTPLAERVANYRQVAALLASPLCQQHYAWNSKRLFLKEAA